MQKSVELGMKVFSIGQEKFQLKTTFKSRISILAQYANNQEGIFDYAFTTNQELDFVDSTATNTLLRNDYEDDCILHTGGYSTYVL